MFVERRLLSVNLRGHGSLYQHKPVLDKIGERVYSWRHPEVDRLYERLHLIDRLDLPRKALEWIGECSDLDRAVKAEGKRGDNKTGFDLINVRLLMLHGQRMEKSKEGSGRGYNQQAGQHLDGLLEYLVSDRGAFGKYEKVRDKPVERKGVVASYSVPEMGLYLDPQKVKYDEAVFRCLDSYHTAESNEAKAGVLDQFLGFNEFYASGRNMALSTFLGIPEVDIFRGINEQAFLERLRNFHRPEFWKNEIVHNRRRQTVRRMTSAVERIRI